MSAASIAASGLHRIAVGVKQTVKAAVPRSILISTLRTTPDARLLLTFDDGPHDAVTDRVLLALDRLGAKALFFIIGERVAGREAAIRRIAAAGHEIGNHSFTHPAPEGKTVEFLAQDLRACQASIAAVTGKPPRYYRPPMGRLTLPLLTAAKREGVTPVHWSLEGGEWGRNQHRSTDEIAHHLAGALRPGGIALLHDDCERVPDILDHPAFTHAAARYDLGAAALAAL